ncbi:MAG: hypothetical protein H6R18_2435 [Proteobacteria bacterium]|nr:hypothetical protein [Pseudomonadota bacterium]
MHIDMFKAFRQFVTEQGVLFYYNGYLSQPIVAATGEALRGRLEADNGSGKVSRKVFSTFVEMMQNILHYSEGGSVDLNEKVPFGNVAVGRLGERYYIVSGNIISSQHINRLRDKLETIRAMSSDEIKAEYKRKLRGGEQDDNSKGAGLGFLTVAREASEPIEYSFEALPGSNDALSFFYLKASI